ncbi:phosphate ABC transporter substrate-binding protein [Skermanella stibiiresistens SB22]|uniref:Phosphate-binding protein PstS n=1 Tax=Skermanella stibiiresistens SB22 TaxID=1385369 RepID=W9GY51_9PROT|nr:phosphate ABC transporter substrate-binding protein PstS [Skermanella stibiiresistens]EWY38860.1 phosphate ABC transporter substrate-binding protein [Skermanella stibiiresistens SB22]
MTIFAKTVARGAIPGLAGAVLGSMAFVFPAQAIDISGAGATFPYPVYARWAQAYQQETGTSVNYQAIGSGGGIRQIKERTVTFGASDSPLKPEDLEKAGLVQFPMLMGGVVPIINVKGVKPGQLKLDGATLAKIYLGTIETWDDPAIKALNPGLELPDLAIAPIYRADGSGTNFLFTNYLSEVSPEFKEQVGSNTSVQWPAGIGARGNEGVAAMAGRTRGAIGYVEFAYAKQNKMTDAVLKSRDGEWVAPASEAFQAAAAGADWTRNPGFYVILTNQPGPGSWPITGASFILMPREPKDAEASRSALRFFDWAYANGDKMAEDLGYVPMPDTVVKQVEQTWASGFANVNGEALWNGDQR